MKGLIIPIRSPCLTLKADFLFHLAPLKWKYIELYYYRSPTVIFRLRDDSKRIVVGN